MLNVDDGMLLN